MIECVKSVEIVIEVATAPKIYEKTDTSRFSYPFYYFNSVLNDSLHSKYKLSNYGRTYVSSK